MTQYVYVPVPVTILVKTWVEHVGEEVFCYHAEFDGVHTTSMGSSDAAIENLKINLKAAGKLHRWTKI